MLLRGLLTLWCVANVVATLTMYACTDAVTCAPATCTAMTVPEAQCLATPAGAYVLKCAPRAPMQQCAYAGRYMDDKCTQLVSHDQAVCGTCSMGIAQTCPKNAQTVVGRFNCTDPATCGGRCGGSVSFPLLACVSMYPIVDPFVPGPYLKVLSFGNCTDSIVSETAYSTPTCASGTAVGSLVFEEMLCMNHNGTGYMYKCDA